MQHCLHKRLILRSLGKYVINLPRCGHYTSTVVKVNTALRFTQHRYIARLHARNKRKDP